jgi:hypothetical protein
VVRLDGEADYIDHPPILVKRIYPRT